MFEALPVIDPLIVAAGWGLFLVLGIAGAWWFPGQVVVRAPWVLAGVVATTALAAGVLVRTDPPGLRLEIDPSTEPLLPRGDPARELYQQAVRDFGDDEVFVIAMEAPGTLFTHEHLARLRRITDAVAQLGGVRRVQSLTDVVSFRYSAEEDWVEVRPLIEDLPRDPAALEALAERTLRDPLYRHTLVSPDGRSAAVNVTFRKMNDREFIASGIDAAIAAIVDQERAPGLSFHVAGRPHLKAHVYRVMLRDLTLLVPLALAAMAAVLFIVFGTLRGVVLPLATVATATVWTFATISLVGRPLNILTTLLAPTLTAVGSVYGVHVVARFEEEALRSRGRRKAAERCLHHMRLPVVIAGATTAIGFAALLTSDVPAVFELGAFSALGIASVTLLSLTGLPACLALGRPIHPSSTSWSAGLAAVMDRILLRTGRFGARRATGLLLFWSLLASLALLALPRIVIDTDYLSYFDEDEAVRVDFDAVNRVLAGAVPIYVPLRASEAGRLRDPEVLRALEQLQTRAGLLSAVGHTESMVDTLRVLNRALAGDDPEEERIPDSRPAVAELLFLAPKGHLDRFTNVNHSRANLIVRTGAVGTAAMRELSRGLEELLREGTLPRDLDAGVTGNAILLARSADGIARSQPLSIGLAAGAILVLIAVGLASWRLGLLAMIPNVLPVLLFFGVLGAGVAPLSLPTSLIGCVALGIAIDDTVHILVRYREERRAGRAPEAAAIVAAQRVGRPVTITSFMLVAGFLVVALSGFATLQEFGLLCALTMAICLASDLLLLPALLVRARA
ncbi:MAG: MMPL family transporter [Myxococcota bacterium]